MKKAISFVLQFLLFLATFAAGIVAGVFSPLHLRWFVSHPTPATIRYFDPTGLLLMLTVFVLVLLIEVARKIIRRAGPLTTGALALAALVGILFKIGWVQPL